MIEHTDLMKVCSCFWSILNDNVIRLKHLVDIRRIWSALEGRGEKDFPLDVVRKEELLKFMDDGRMRGNKTSTMGRQL